ncbi:guanylate kinase [Cyclobacteriaceae bacterium]|jgi:guanylate kinase|nr:guanylate kinase [Cyclobacteriaceae bacterium]MDB4316128.1 guanylate kinase [Cyclobacteriaceae bacterium]MDC1369173.1 guanylate kinase [Cyclobacteriaceae bacterium]|tara:strand:+ start:1252 stop:1827 length:576 start_codon:yes stop_codon:yes gene_type:complete
MKSGKAVIFSAPSGSGKSTIVNHLLAKRTDLEFSVSATTRRRRSTEVSEKDYHFLSVQDFLGKVDQGAFLEYEEVYPGIYYGTLQSELDRIWNAGNHVIFDLDVKGGIKLNEILKTRALAIYIKVEDISILQARLLARGTENQEQITSRLSKVAEESTFETKFDVSILNHDLDVALESAERAVNHFLEGNT